MKDKNVVVEVQKYGDFDILYTDSIWIAPEGTPVPEYDGGNTRDTSEFIKLLKMHGFACSKTKTVKFGGNL